MKFFFVCRVTAPRKKTKNYMVQNMGAMTAVVAEKFFFNALGICWILSKLIKIQRTQTGVSLLGSTSGVGCYVFEYLVF